MTAKEKVEQWLEEKSEIIPLQFYGFEEKNYDTKFREVPLDYLIVKILDLTKKYSSQNSKTGNVETAPHKYRSSYDIWRHVLFFQPNHSLLDVMDSIYRNEKKFYGQYCTTIYRRVFRTKDSQSMWLDNEGRDYKDEYGLEFYEWEKEE